VGEGRRQHEGIPIINFLVPKTFVTQGQKLTGMTFEKVKAVYDAKGKRSLVPTGEPDQFFECDDVLVAVGQENSFPWIEKDSGIEFDKYGLPNLDKTTFQSSVPNVFFGGDSAFGPKNIIWAVAHGHDAAVSIDKLLNKENLSERPAPGVTLVSQKMGIHEWSYDNEIAGDSRYKVPWADIKATLKNVKMEVELGFDVATAWKEAQRCLNCDVQTVFTDKLCIECDACVDICPMDCISFVPNAEEDVLRKNLNAPAQNATQDLYVSGLLKTTRVMVEGRGRLPALRPVRRALPDGRVGHAEVPRRDDLRRLRLPQP
jgi:ferredoxin